MNSSNFDTLIDALRDAEFKCGQEEFAKKHAVNQLNITKELLAKEEQANYDTRMKLETWEKEFSWKEIYFNKDTCEYEMRDKQTKVA